MVAILQHTENEPSGLIGDFFEEKRFSLRIFSLYRDPIIKVNFDELDAVVVLGGPMNVYEEEKYKFLSEETQFIKTIVRHRIPFLGICLGAQLLAKSQGARVYRAVTPEVGFGEVFLTKEGKRDPLFSGCGDSIRVFQWHEDTFDIPDKKPLLAQSRDCISQAFRLNSVAYGLQFHLEVTAPMLDLWQEGIQKMNMINTCKKERWSNNVHIRSGELRQQAYLILNNFLKIMRTASI